MYVKIQGFSGFKKKNFFSLSDYKDPSIKLKIFQ